MQRRERLRERGKRKSSIPIRDLVRFVLISTPILIIDQLSDLIEFRFSGSEITPTPLWVTAGFTFFGGVVPAILIIGCAFMLVRTGRNFKDTIAVSACFIAIAFSLVVIGFARAYEVCGLLDGDAITHDGWACLYFSIITWTSVGYGDLTPSLACRPFAAGEAITSSFVQALVIGTLAAAGGALVSRLSKRETSSIARRIRLVKAAIRSRRKTERARSRRRVPAPGGPFP